jgi:hypothetical protein
MLNRDLELDLNLEELAKKDVSPQVPWNSGAQPITAPTTQNTIGKYEVRRSTDEAYRNADAKQPSTFEVKPFQCHEEPMQVDKIETDSVIH